MLEQALKSLAKRYGVWIQLDPGPIDYFGGCSCIVNFPAGFACKIDTGLDPYPFIDASDDHRLKVKQVFLAKVEQLLELAKTPVEQVPLLIYREEYVEEYKELFMYILKHGDLYRPLLPYNKRKVNVEV